MRNKKRGISPLIASVLLIGFTIAIVAMIFIWWGDFVKQKTIKEGLKNEAERACMDEVDIDVKSAKETANGLEFIINNRGSEKIVAFRFRIDDDSDSGVSTVFVQDEIGAVSQGTVPVINTDYGDNPKQAQVIPVILVSSTEGSLSYSCTNTIIKIKIEEVNK